MNHEISCMYAVFWFWFSFMFSYTRSSLNNLRQTRASSLYLFPANNQPLGLAKPGCCILGATFVFYPLP